MRMDNGEIHTQEELKKMFGDKAEEIATPLTDEEHAALEPMNRHERRAALVKMRREARAAKK